MTQNEKDLLLKDLCSRVPYGVKAISKIPINQNESKKIVGQITSVHYNIGIVQMGGFDVIVDYNPYFEIKPYLFPLSSMTEEQKVEFDKMAELDIEYTITQIKNDAPNWTSGLSRFNWLLKNHFDVYGLIPMGLALDATGKNIY